MCKEISVIGNVSSVSSNYLMTAEHSSAGRRGYPRRYPPPWAFQCRATSRSKGLLSHSMASPFPRRRKRFPSSEDILLLLKSGRRDTADLTGNISSLRDPSATSAYATSPYFFMSPSSLACHRPIHTKGNQIPSRTSSFFQHFVTNGRFDRPCHSFDSLSSAIPNFLPRPFAVPPYHTPYHSLYQVNRKFFSHQVPLWPEFYLFLFSRTACTPRRRAAVFDTAPSAILNYQPNPLSTFSFPPSTSHLKLPSTANHRDSSTSSPKPHLSHSFINKTKNHSTWTAVSTSRAT